MPSPRLPLAAASDRWVAVAGLALTVGVSLVLQVLMDARAPLSLEESCVANGR